MTTWLPSDLQARFGRFAASAAPWIAAGFNVIPSRGVGDKRPACQFKHLYQNDSERVGRSDLEIWAQGHTDAPALLLPSSGADLGLVVIDIDDPALGGWVFDTFGETPLVVQTGREGGGLHAYYRVAAGERVTGSNSVVGPEGVSKSRIDVKAWGGYVVAPGSLHQTGVEYAPGVGYAELTHDLLASLPLFDVKLYDREREAGFRRRGRLPRSRVPAPGERPSAWLGAFADAGVLEPDEIVRDERGVERTLREIGDGERIYAPGRDDSNPSATVFKRGSAQFVYDWSLSERWSIADESNIDFDALIGGASKNRHPTFLLTKGIDEGGGSAAAPCAKDAVGDGDGDPDDLDGGGDCDFPAYLDADAPIAGAKDPMRLAEHGLAMRVEHITIPPELDNIREAVKRCDGRRPADVTLIQSPPGTGKTQVMEDAWRAPSVVRAIAVVPSIALAHAAAERLGGGAVSYQDEGAAEAHKLVTTIHSLARFDPGPIDLLAIDEFSAIMDALCAPRSLVDQPVETLMHLLHLIRSAKRVIIGDADLEPWHVAYLAERIATTQTIRLYTHEHKSSEQVVIASIDYTSAQMLEALERVERARLAGEHMVIAVQYDTKAGAQQVAKVIEQLYPELKVACITGDNADEREVQDELANPDAMLERYNVISHNTAMSTGVSFNAKVSGVFTFYENRDIAPKSIMQMHMRFRRAHTRFVGIVPWKPEPRPRFSRDIWRRHKKRNSADAQLLKRKLKDAFTIDLDGDYRIDNPHYEAAFFGTARQDSVTFCDRVAEIHRIAALRIYDLELSDEDVTAEQAAGVEGLSEWRRQVAKGLKIERCETVAEAAKISNKEAEVIEKKHIRTKPEKAALEKHKLEAFYEREVTPELVEHDRNGKTRGELTRLARIRMMLDGHGEELALICHEKNKGKTLARQRALYLEAYAISELLEDVFLLDDLPPGVDWFEHLRSMEFKAPDIAERTWAFLEDYGGAISTLDVAGKMPKEQKDAVRWLHNLLRKLGIRTAKQKHGSGCDGACWCYRYLVESPCELGHPCYLRMRSSFAKAAAARKWSEAIDALTQAA